MSDNDNIEIAVSAAQEALLKIDLENRLISNDVLDKIVRLAFQYQTKPTDERILVTKAITLILEEDIEKLMK
jgi:hypothetical protein